MDTLHHWQRTYRRELDEETRQECLCTERLLKKAVAGGDEEKRVTRLCEVQDGSSSVSVCGLTLAPSSLNPLLRALKLQASLTELRLSGNRLSDNILPELVATAVTMPRLQLLDVSANGLTGEGLEKAVDALKGQSQPAFPMLAFMSNPDESEPVREPVCDLGGPPQHPDVHERGFSTTDPS
ncbi:hypothetical protein XENOCAPTIV_004130 [Xenoophorus captivus]|uniref:Tonsoku-like protein n=1 Tax=Xenoophorus captivus TaxID=1517983 RepID=A0ABV0QPU1_9TELE